MAKARKPAQKYTIRWALDDGTKVTYVDRPAGELRSELERVRNAGLLAAKVLSRLRRVRNSSIQLALFELAHCSQAVPEDAPPKWLADEIARLSFTYSGVVKLLNLLSNSRVRWLEEARFLLTYGQTPIKRDTPTKPALRRYAREDFDESYDD